MGKFLGAPAGVLDLAMGYLSDNPMRMSAAFNYDDHLAAWQDTIRAAETHYVPGEFTTFIGYEWTVSSPAPESAAYHRNVLFESSSAPTRPFTRVDSVNPEDLWDWMDELRSKGVDSLAIPHNSNQSNGQTFRQTYWDGRAVDKAYSQQRNRNETLIELVQLKGSSDTHPRLSPQDDWADFEILNTRKGSVWRSSNPHGSYFRQALQNGLVLKKENRGNPFRFGVIGSSDTHNATPSFNESAHFGSTPISTPPVNRASVPVDDARRAQLESLPASLRARVQLSEEAAGAYLPMRTTQFGTSGLAAVWAEENTREAIFAAMKRKETYATSGTRIRLRFFAGDLDEVNLDSPALIDKLYSEGVPMGGDLLKADEAPSFFVWAQKGEDGAPLQRVQIIKGWYNDGYQKQTEERIFDVACADGLEVDPQTHRCPDNGAQVNLADCSITEGLGASDLRTVWRDPDFDPDIDAVYYVRVLENPTCRWSTWDAVRAGVPPRDGVAPVIQERAWSSPIWYLGGAK